jgi:DNA-directed RNA polymerase subunit E'/Rpb7
MDTLELIPNEKLLVSPYTKQIIKASILIPPVMLNNLFEINVKEHVINTFEKRCINNYGYINKIYKITKMSGGKIEAENQACSANLDIEFYALLCYPIIKRHIVCKISRITEGLTLGVNGPIICIIIADDIDSNHFYVDSELNLRIKQNNAILKEGDYVKVLINTVDFKNNDINVDDYNELLTTTRLISIATEEEIKNTYLSDEDL